MLYQSSPYWVPSPTGYYAPRIRPAPVILPPPPGLAARALGQEPELDDRQLATSMVLRGAVGTVIGAAVAPAGQEGRWGALGFAVGAMFGEAAIVGVAVAALWRKS